MPHPRFTPGRARQGRDPVASLVEVRPSRVFPRAGFLFLGNILPSLDIMLVFYKIKRINLDILAKY